MDFVNELESLQTISKLSEQLKKAKNDLDTFLNCLEGDAKTATNTQKEEGAIAYWKNIIDKQKQDYENSQNYMNNQLEQLRVNYERSVGIITKQKQQNEMNYLTSVHSIGNRLANSEEALQRKLTRKKPKRQLELEKVVQDVETQITSRRKRLEEARQKGTLL